VTLTATAGGGSTLGSWSGACSGNADICTLTLSTEETVLASFRKADVTVFNHIIIMVQENRSFDHYFGHLAQY